MVSYGAGRLRRCCLESGWCEHRRRQDRPQRNGANNDSGIVQPPTGGPIFLAIYVAAPDASPEARDNLVAETARISIAALTRPVGAAK